MQRQELFKWEMPEGGDPTTNSKPIALKDFEGGSGLRLVTRCEVVELIPELEDDDPGGKIPRLVKNEPCVAVVFHSSEGVFTADLDSYCEQVREQFGFVRSSPTSPSS